MQSSLIGRVVLGIAVVAAAVVLLVVLSDSDSDDGGVGGTTTAAQGGGASENEPGGGAAARREAEIPTIVVKAGKPVGGVEELVVSAGERIRFAVRADSEDEVHVHGYDVEREVGPGRVARFDFPATIEGLFEAELHGSGEQIAELRVEP